MPPVARIAVALGCAALIACAQQAQPPRAAPTASPRPQAAAAPSEVVASPGPAVAATSQAEPQRETAARRRPPWLGQRVLPRRADGYGQIRPTPRVLRDRRLVTPEILPPPRTIRYAARIRRVPRDVLARSTWSPACPVGVDQLRYVTVTFAGFDGRAHTGELLVHRSVARDIVGVFHTLYRARFPIEEMRVVRRAELDLPPTGDGNNTTSFVCRPSRGTTTWSQHAYGLAVDVNPFHNPYVKHDVVLPERASAYVDRTDRRPGMHHAGGISVQAFAAIGWRWGGDWTSLRDYMHFSRNGR